MTAIAERRRRPARPRSLMQAGRVLLPRIRRLEVMLFDAVWGERRHLSNGCEVLHVIRGRIALEVGVHTFEAGPGDTLVVPARTLHRDRFDLDRGLEVLYASVDWPWIPRAFAGAGNAALLALTPARKAELGVLAQHLAADRSPATPADRLVAQARLLELLCLVRRAASPARADAAPPPTPREAQVRRRRLVEETHAFIERNHARPLTLAAIAAALGVSACHLSRVFRAETGLPLFARLAAVRMDRARVLLRDRRNGVAEVARAVGYDNPHHFAKAFRRHAGCAPRDYAARAAVPRKG